MEKKLFFFQFTSKSCNSRTLPELLTLPTSSTIPTTSTSQSPTNSPTPCPPPPPPKPHHRGKKPPTLTTRMSTTEDKRDLLLIEVRSRQAEQLKLLTTVNSNTWSIDADKFFAELSNSVKDLGSCIEGLEAATTTALPQALLCEKVGGPTATTSFHTTRVHMRGTLISITPWSRVSLNVMSCILLL